MSIIKWIIRISTDKNPGSTVSRRENQGLDFPDGFEEDSMSVASTASIIF